MASSFEELGIKVQPGKVRFATICPQCNDKRQKHKNAPCLTVNNEEGNRWFKCWHCNWSGNLDIFDKYEKVREKSRMPKQMPEIYSQEVMEYWKRRGIDYRVAIKEKIFEFIMNKKPILGFPFYVNDTLVNVKYLNIRWQPGDEGPKWWQMNKELGTKIIPWGMQSLNFEDDIPKTVIWTEGELDRLTWLSAGYKNVLSEPQGAPSVNSTEFKDKFAYAEDRYFKSVMDEVDLIIFSTDGDEPGRHLRNHLSILLGKVRCKYINYPIGYKDINEVWAGDVRKGLMPLGQPGVDECYQGLSSFPVKGIVRPSDVRGELDILKKDGFQPGLGCGVAEVDRLFTLKPKMFTAITGLPSCFAGDQLIHTSRGVMPISEIKQGDKVLSYNHKKDQNEYRYVEEVLCRKNHPKKLYKIKLKDGTIIKVTEDHKFFTGISYMQIKEILLSLKNNSNK